MNSLAEQELHLGIGQNGTEARWQYPLEGDREEKKQPSLSEPISGGSQCGEQGPAASYQGHLLTTGTLTCNPGAWPTSQPARGKWGNWGCC